jgi:hypothetical protein
LTDTSGIDPVCQGFLAAVIVSFRASRVNKSLSFSDKKCAVADGFAAQTTGCIGYAAHSRAVNMLAFPLAWPEPAAWRCQDF